jgi:hypothetical protein
MNNVKKLLIIFTSSIVSSMTSQSAIASMQGNKPTKCPSEDAIRAGVKNGLGYLAEPRGGYSTNYEFPEYQYKFDTDFYWMVNILFSPSYDPDGNSVVFKVMDQLGGYHGVPILQENNSSWVCYRYGSIRVGGHEYDWMLVSETEA